MKRILCFFFIAIAFHGFSQNGKQKTHAEKLKEKIVLVVPFSLILYNNEASKEMIEASGMQYKQVQNFMRVELDRNLHKAISDSCRSRSLLQSYTTQTDRDELEYIYANSDYFLSEAMSYNPQKKPLFNKSKVATDKDADKKNKKKKKEEKEQKEINNNGDIQSDIRNNPDKFLNVKFREKDFLKNLSKRDNVDYFLFINQFEIKGDYSDPYKTGNLSYNREIKVNFSIFSNDGQYLYGSYAVMEFPATENNLQKISDNYFEKLAKEIVKNIPF